MFCVPKKDIIKWKVFWMEKLYQPGCMFDQASKKVRLLGQVRIIESHVMFLESLFCMLIVMLTLSLPHPHTPIIAFLAVKNNSSNILSFYLFLHLGIIKVQFHLLSCNSHRKVLQDKKLSRHVELYIVSFFS